MLRPHQSPSSQGFTLVEAMLATAIFTFVASGIISGLVFSRHMTRLNTNAVMAKNIAQGYFERIKGDKFAQVNSASHPNVEYDSDPPVYLDRALGMKCKIDIEFDGFGRATSGSGSSLVDTDAHWEANSWEGAYLYLVDGAGEEQWAEIQSNTANSLTITGATFDPVPAVASAGTSGTAYMINNGKTVTITTTWEYRGREYTQRLSALVTNHNNDEDLGF